MNLPELKTIVAVATPPGYGGIGIIRLSGSSSLPLVRGLLSKGNGVSFLPNYSTLHRIINPSNRQTIDEVLITYFKSPYSFTGEDVVEISCHGSPVVLSEILHLLVSSGAELAQPGEFSLRAFLNQRIDLTQAEAINDLIHAQTSQQARVAARQLRGELSTQLASVKEGLKELIVHFESTVEFVEDDLDPLDLKLFVQRVDQFIDGLSKLASTYRVGKLIRSGIKLALIGRPNVGKSSLFNALLGYDRAIVSHLPGTTRDTLNETFAINGIPINLVDTAGIRETEEIIEKIGIERTKTVIAEADLVIAVIESNSRLPPEEKTLFAQFPISLYVISKCDLGVSIPSDEIEKLKDNVDVVQISAITGDGIEELTWTIQNSLLANSKIEDAIITNERHYVALEQTLGSLNWAKRDLLAGFTEEIALANLHQALKSLGIITGETLVSDIINQIFSTFCIGK